MTTTARSVKNATLVFGTLIRIDVKLMSAARDEGTGFNSVHQHEDGTVTKINEQKFCSGCNSVVPYEHLKKGVDMGDGTFVVLEKAELDLCKPTSEKEIVIEKFVCLNEVDPIFFDNSYFLVPDPGKSKNPNPASLQAYEVLYQLLKRRGHAGVAKMEMRGKEHNVFVRVFGNGLMLHTIFTSNEVRELDAYNAPRTVPVNEAHLAICDQLLDSLMGKFDPKGVESEQEKKIELLIASKKAGAAPSTPGSGSTTTPKDDLLSKLTASLMNANAKKEQPTGAAK